MEQQNKQTNKHLSNHLWQAAQYGATNKQTNISKENLSDRQRSMEQVKSRMTLLLIHLSVADLIVILFQVSLISCYLYFLPSNEIEGQKILLLLN